MAESKETTQLKPRNKRKPFGQPRSKLAFSNLDEKYHYRIVNDEVGRVDDFLERDYIFVSPEEVGREGRGETKVKILVGKQKNGEALYGYLMKIPKEYYEEDRQDMQEHLNKIDDAIRGGKLDRQQNDGRYVPDGGISIKT